MFDRPLAIPGNCFVHKICGTFSHGLWLTRGALGANGGTLTSGLTGTACAPLPVRRCRAGFEKDVSVAGVLERIEIWSPSRYEAGQTETVMGLEDIKRTLNQGNSGS